MPSPASSGYSPSGTFQTYRPVVKSMALSVPHGGFTAGYPSGSRNRPYSTRDFCSIGGLPPWPPVRFGGGGLKVRRSLRLTSDGNVGGDPFRSAPWQPAHCVAYSSLPPAASAAGARSTRATVHGISFALT